MNTLVSVQLDTTGRKLFEVIQAKENNIDIYS